MYKPPNRNLEIPGCINLALLLLSVNITMYIVLDISYCEAGKIFTFLAFKHIGNRNFMSKVKIRFVFPYPLYSCTPYSKVAIHLVMPQYAGERKDSRMLAIKHSAT